MQTQRNLSIDTLRLLASLEVIALHTTYASLPALVGIVIRLQARWAVPFFFIISGYFLAQRLADAARADVRPAIYRFMWIFLLWNIIYIPVVLYEHGAKEVFRRLLFSTFVYLGEYFHLWFPSALVFGFLTLLFVFHYRLEKWLPLISIGIMLNIFISGSYRDVFNIKFPFDFETARHWVSVPTLALGIWLFRRGPLNRWLAFGLAAGGFGLQLAEAWFLQTRFGIDPYNHEILIGTLPFALGIASLAISGLRILEWPVVSHWGRDYSLGVYLIHALVTFAAGLILVTGLHLPLESAVWDILFPFLVLLAGVGIFAALRNWAPAAFRFLLGNRLSSGD